MFRKDPLITNHIYHIFNRGVNKGEIFYDDDDYRHLYLTAIHYKNNNTKFSYEKLVGLNDTGSLREPLGKSGLPFNPKVQILAYCLMPNHFHLLLKQLEDRGITWYLQHVINSYVHYLNVKHDRSGPLFQGRFKNVLIESDEQLIHVSRYLHLNPLVSNLTSDLKSYPWSSFNKYIGNADDELCDIDLVSEFFKSTEGYEQFVMDQADYGRTLERIKHLTLDR